MKIYTVEHVLNVTTGASRVVGQVVAPDHEQATERAVEQGLIPFFQTYRLRLREDTSGDLGACECYHSCGSCSHSGDWHTHEGEPCPVHPDAVMVG